MKIEKNGSKKTQVLEKNLDFEHWLYFDNLKTYNRLRVKYDKYLECD